MAAGTSLMGVLFWYDTLYYNGTVRHVVECIKTTHTGATSHK